MDQAAKLLPKVLSMPRLLWEHYESKQGMMAVVTRHNSKRRLYASVQPGDMLLGYISSR